MMPAIKGSGLPASFDKLRADANGLFLAVNTYVADVDIAAAIGKIIASEGADGNVSRSCIVIERMITHGRVGRTMQVLVECLKAHRRIVAAVDILMGRISTANRVVAAGHVAIKRSNTSGGVVVAFCVGGECAPAVCGISATFCVVEKCPPNPWPCCYLQ